MANDPRLRARLSRLAGDAQPDVEDRLARTVGSVRRRARVRELGSVAFETLAIAVVVVVILVQVNSRPAGEVGTSAAPGLTGSWTTTVDASNQELAAAGMAGRWTIGFPASGVLDVVAPPGFTAPRTGYAFQVTGDQLRTDLLGESVCSGVAPGIYRFVVTGSSLELTVIDDGCQPRMALLASGTWINAEGSGSG